MNKLLRFAAQHYLQSTALTILLKFYQQGRSHAKCFHYYKIFQMFNWSKDSYPYLNDTQICAPN